MKIVVCDDDKIWLSQAEEIVKSYGETEDIPMTIRCFLSGAEMLEQKFVIPDVLFLDIELGSESGIDIAAKVNEVWPNCLIVYLTDYLNYAIDVYQTKHVFFMVKGQFENRIDDIFRKIHHEIHQRTQKLVFELHGGKDVHGGTVLLSPREILYFERHRRLTRIVTEHGEYMIHEKLNDLFQQISPIDFVRCHNSYVVYLPAVLIKGKNSFLMKNQEEIVISRSYHEKVQEMFLRWATLQ